MVSTLKRKLAISAVLLLMVSVFTACSSNKDSGETPAENNSQETVSTVQETSDDAPAAGAIKSDKVYKIATDIAFKPFTYSDDEGNLVGFDIDIFQAIADDQGINFEFQPLGFESACAALETGQADGAICCMNIKEERKLKYDFSDPYYTSSVVVIVKEDSGYNDLSDLSGKKAGAKITTDAEKYANDMAAEYGSETVGVEDFVSAMMMLDSGNIDAIVDDITVAKMAVAEKEGYKIIGDPGYEADVGFAVPKDKNPELLAAFNEGLKNIRENGKYDEILKKNIG